ncbi:MAG: succinate--CoA ligase subunit alpha [Chloroflexi bacterium]|nr:succinate--CoA ligase subunit alpha [Chloroflexota bacterium]
MILLDQNTRGIVQGVTGRVGSVQTKWMVEYGSSLVAGVTPGKGGQTVHGLPVYDTVQETVERHGANASVIFVPAPAAKAAVQMALEVGLKLVVVITEHVPVHDSLAMKRMAQEHGAWLLGPNCPGLLTPSVGKLGIMPGNLFRPGPVGVVGRSATLTYEVAGNLSAAGLGQSTAVGVGGDMVTGSRFLDVLRLFEADPQTEAVALVGEIGGTAEEEAARFIKEMTKPVVALIAGRNAPVEKKLGHAGAIIRGGQGTPQSKVAALAAAGVAVADSPAEVARLVRERLRRD